MPAQGTYPRPPPVLTAPPKSNLTSVRKAIRSECTLFSLAANVHPPARALLAFSRVLSFPPIHAAPCFHATGAEKESKARRENSQAVCARWQAGVLGVDAFSPSKGI